MLQKGLLHAKMFLCLLITCTCGCTIHFHFVMFYFVFRCDSIEKLRKRAETLEKEIQDAQQFKDFYQFTFNFAKNPGQKGLGEP